MVPEVFVGELLDGRLLAGVVWLGGVNDGVVGVVVGVAASCVDGEVRRKSALEP